MIIISCAVEVHLLTYLQCRTILLSHWLVLGGECAGSVRTEMFRDSLWLRNGDVCRKPWFYREIVSFHEETFLCRTMVSRKLDVAVPTAAQVRATLRTEIIELA